MSHVNPVLPNDGDSGWGDTLNSAIQSIVNQGNAHDDQIAAIGSPAAPPSATTSTQGVVQLAGDLTGSASAPVLRSIVTAGTVGSSSALPVISYDAKGRVTAASSLQLDAIIAALVNTTGSATRAAVLNLVGTTNTGGSGGTTPAASASGQAPPAADAFTGFTQTIVQDFATDCAVGSFANTYPGWAGYDGNTSGASGTTWNSATTMSVTNSVLRMRNWMSNGVAQAGALTPLVPGTGGWTTQAQTYGKYIVRFKAESTVGFKVAWLLWPTNNNWNQGEIDFPEANLNGKIQWATHNITGTPADQLWGNTSTNMADGNWHTATTTWEAGKITYELDGTVVSTVTNTSYVPSTPMRWDLQNEKSTDGSVPTAGSDASVYIDWLVQYKKG